MPYPSFLPHSILPAECICMLNTDCYTLVILGSYIDRKRAIGSEEASDRGFWGGGVSKSPLRVKLIFREIIRALTWNLEVNKEWQILVAFPGFL